MLRTLTYSFNFFAVLLFLAMPAFAQSYNDNYDPARSNVTLYPPGDNPTEGVPPPPGSVNPGGANPLAGAVAPAVTPGDQPSNWNPVPTGTESTNPQYGTYFGHQNQSFRSRVNLLVNRGSQIVNGATVDRGTRVALTFQPDELTDSQRSQVEGILNLGAGGLAGNQPYQNITVSTATLQQIQQILYPPAKASGNIYPYPGTPGNNIRNTPWTTRTFIAADSPAAGYPRYPSQEIPFLKQEIRDFAHYLVILGVVMACVQLVFVGAMMAFGHPYSGSKAVAAAGGLMLLLMAYTIWKVDIFHVLTARPAVPQDATAADSFDIRTPPIGNALQQVTGSNTYEGDMTLPQDQKSQVGTSAAHPQVALPAIPASGSGQSAARPGLPLAPLASAH